MTRILSLAAAYVFSTANEWFWHRYLFLFHGLGRKKGGPASFHLHEHHPRARANGGVDIAFDSWRFKMNPEGGPHNGRMVECLGLAALGVLYLPTVVFFPWFYLGILLHGAVYHLIHRRSHLNPEWCRERLPWHWKHHMENPHKNYCVTSNWFDRLVGTT